MFIEQISLLCTFRLREDFLFRSYNLIEKAFTIPSKYKLNNGIPKYVLRKVAQKYIAPECLSMQKRFWIAT